MLVLMLALGLIPAAGLFAADGTTPNYAFVPNSGEASVSKVDVASGEQVARYWTAPRDTPNPYYWRTSRLALDADGNAWVLNVGADDPAQNLQGQVVRIQADTDGLVLTNHDHAFPLAFGTDEAVQVFDVGLPGEMPRAVAIDVDGNIWIGFYSEKYFQGYTYDEATPSLDVIPGTTVAGDFTPYHAHVDASNTLWFISRNSTPARSTTQGVWSIDLTADPLAAENEIEGSGYAILVDDSDPANIVVWASSYSNVLYKFVNGVHDETITIGAATGQEFRGMCFDNSGKIWIAATQSTSQGTKVWWYNPADGTNGSVTIATSPPANPVGVGIDAAGFIWVVCRNDSQQTGYIAQIDPADPAPVVLQTIATGYRPYVYDAYILPPAPELYSICGFKFAEWEGERIPLPNWEITLEKWDGDSFVEFATTSTDENGRYCFTDLPAGTYRISEDLKEGWDQVYPEGSHEVTLPASIVYGIERYSGDVYGVDVLAGTSWLEFEMPTPPGANSASPNGLAYNPENGYLYYTDYQLGTYPDTLYFWDGTAQGVAGQIAAGTVACGDIDNGKYYYIPSNTDDLYEVTFNPDGTIDTDTKLDDISGNVHRWTFDGDIAVKGGVVYGWGRCAVSGHGFEFFTYHLTSGAFDFTKPAYQQSLQLAFGSDGVLYGHRSGTGGYFYAVDTTDGGVTLVEPTPDPANQYTDCASGQSLYNFVNTPTLYCFDETAWAAQGDYRDTRFVPARGAWATYIDYKVGDGTETDPAVFKLYAGQTYYAGDLLVCDNSTTLFVKYVASGEAGGYAPEGYCGGTWAGLTEYHLQVVDSLEDFNEYRVYNKNTGEYGAPIPGSFDTIWEGEKVYETGWIQVDIADFADGEILVAAHAVMWWCGYDCDALNEIHLP